MSKFDYKAEGVLNSQYALDLLKEYLSKISKANDTKGIVEDDLKIDTKANKFVRWFSDTTNRIKIKWKNKTLLENYNKILSTKYVESIEDKIKIFLQTNVLEAKSLFELNETLKAINFNVIVPEIEENRSNAIKKSEKTFLKILNDIKYLKNANVDYVLFNSPVSELKPFLSDKVSLHKVNFKELQRLVCQFVDLRHKELTEVNFEPFECAFKAKEEDFYDDNVTDSGVGEDVEEFVRTKMWEKHNILKQEEVLLEDRQVEIDKINALLKKLKVYKIEQMLQNLINLKTNQAKAKEVIDKCKETINSSTIPNKGRIFLLMDNLYYALSKKCETLQAKVKLKLQLVDKQKMFAMLEQLQEEETLPKPNKNKKNVDDVKELYEQEEDGEIHITEDDGMDEAEEEVVIEE